MAPKREWLEVEQMLEVLLVWEHILPELVRQEAVQPGLEQKGQ